MEHMRCWIVIVIVTAFYGKHMPCGNLAMNKSTSWWFSLLETSMAGDFPANQLDFPTSLPLILRLMGRPIRQRCFFQIEHQKLRLCPCFESVKKSGVHFRAAFFLISEIWRDARYRSTCHPSDHGGMDTKRAPLGWYCPNWTSAHQKLDITSKR